MGCGPFSQAPPVSCTFLLAAVRVGCGLYLPLEVTPALPCCRGDRQQGPGAGTPPGAGLPEVSRGGCPACPALRGLGDACGNKRGGFL